MPRKANPRVGDAGGRTLQKTSTADTNNQNAKPVQERHQLADPSACFRAIAYSHALRFSLGELDWHDAVDGAWAASVKLGIETDAAQAVLAEVFRPMRLDLDAIEVFLHAPDPIDDEYEGLSSGFARLCAEADRKVDQQAINRRAEEFHKDIPLVSRDGVASAANMQAAYECALARGRE
jgi:hypothetical protein